ncbi:MAG: hypothetical protein M3Q68_02855 [Actinomycetota bacterium]|nr:hypothetical protein [Actinomycetota bacterium]
MTVPIDLDVHQRPSTTYRALWATIAVLLVAAGIAVPIVGSDRSDEETGVSVSTIAASAATVEEATSVSSDLQMKIDFGGQQATIRSESRADNVAKRGDYTIAYEGLPVPSFSGVFGDGKFFVRIPESARAQSDGRPWAGAVAPDATDAANPAATGSALLRFLAGANGKVTTVGSEEVRDVTTTRYRVDIDAAKLVEQGQKQQSALGFIAPSAAADDAKVKAQPADVWLDAAGRLRRLRLRLEVEAGGQTITLEATNELFDYDKAFTVELPAEGDVFATSNVAAAVGLILQPAPPAS